MDTQESIEELGTFNSAVEMGNIFQGKEFYEILLSAGLKPFVCIAKGDDGNITGVVLAFNAAIPIPILSRFFSYTFVVFGPVLTDEQDPAALDTLLNSLESKARRSGAVQICVKAPFGSDNEQVLERHGFTRVIPMINDCSVIIDLSKSKDDLWKELVGRCRRAIRKAEKNEIKIAEVKTIEDLHKYYKMYLAFTMKKNAYAYPFKLFEGILTRLVPVNRASFFLAYYDGIPIAGVTILVGNGKAMYFNGASLREYQNLRPNNILMWHAICWSKDVAKARIFDLYGIPCGKEYGGEIELGLYNFKTSFGGEIVQECAYYDKTLSPLRYHTLKLSRRMLESTYIKLRNMTQKG